VSGNLFADFATEDEAWDALRQWAAEFGLEELHDLGLMRLENGRPTLVAMEDDLVQRVERELGRVPSKR
jgi:hypothetical protein